MDKKNMVLVGVASFLIGGVVTYSGTQFLDSSEAKIKYVKESSEGTTESIVKIQKAYDLIANNYYKDVESDELTEGAIAGMLDKLEDPYSTYMDKETANQFSQSLDSSFEGIGAEVGSRDGKIIIVSPIKDSPAEKAGLKPNDEITKINDKTTKGLSLNEAVVKIRGKKGSKVKLEVHRPGEKDPINLTLVRDTIPRLTVYSDVKKENGKDIGYLQITSFSEETAEEFKTELDKLEAKNIDGLVLDVRGNPGGYLPTVEGILDQLVTNKKPYVQIENREGKREKVSSQNKTKKEYPIVVLTDGGSASASEILAGALKEVEGYATVGEKTFGKGTVQSTAQMGDGSNIKLTISKWLTPDGNWIHGKGIAPTYEVKQPEYFYVTPMDIKETLKYDDNNVQVKRAQVMLDAIGYEPGREDGYFSKETETAVKAFQTAHGLTVTGRINKETAEKMHAEVLVKIKDVNNDLQLKSAIKIVAK